jgi:hypothetical protein
MHAWQEPGEPKQRLMHWGPAPPPTIQHPQVFHPLQDLNGGPLSHAGTLERGRRRAFTCWLLEMSARLSGARPQAIAEQQNNTNHSGKPTSQ